MTSLMIERLPSPSNLRGARAREAARQRAADALAERTVWCATALAAGRARAGALRTALGRTGWLDVAADPDEDQIARVARDDIVVLHDAVCAGLAEAVRERGAHAVLNVGPAAEGRACVDAYLISWSQARRPGVRVERIAALIPAAGVLAARELADDPAGRPLGWTSVFAEVLRADRGETVGGTYHARPVVAAR